jgi:hypothetical protein
MAALPRDERGWIVPWFVVWKDGEPVFPAFDPQKWRRAVYRQSRRCWVCGEPLGRTLVFCIGPMCAINRITSEPPCHLDCATYAVMVCPFIVNPRMGRVPEAKVPGGKIIPPAGMHDDRNPGIMLLWPTEDYRVIRMDNGPLLEIDAPTGSVQWWTLGRRATPREAADAFANGAVKLRMIAEAEDAAAVKELNRLLGVARLLLPEPDLYLPALVEAVA